MPTQINNLQVRAAKFDSSRMTDYNHWSKMLAIKPEIFSNPHRKLFASRTNSLDLSKGNLISSVFGVDSTRYINDLTWGWDLEIDGCKPITILENLTAGSTPGKFFAPIKVRVDVDFAAIGERWSPGSSDKTQTAILKHKQKDGARGFIYEWQVTESVNAYIYPRYLEPGVSWTRFYTERGEAAESGGHLENKTKVEFQNNLAKLRKEFKVTDFAAQAVIEVAFKDETGKAYTSWFDRQEAEYHMAMNRELSIYALYSRLTDQPMIDPDSGYPISPGAGAQQQIGFGGNVEMFNVLSAELIESFFDKIVYARINPGELGEVIGLSGHYGMKAFSKALDVWSGGKAIVRESGEFIQKDAKGIHNNSLKAGYQYTAFSLPNGGTFRLMHNPFNDSKDVHRDIDPITNVPLESQRITILDVTGGNNMSINPKDNIRLVRKNKVFGTTIIPGRVGPGGTIVKNPTHPGDYYEVHISDSIGIEITDSTVTGELVKAYQTAV